MDKMNILFTKRGEDGMGLIEVVVALALLLLILVPSSILLSSTVNTTIQLSERSAASELATLQLSCMRSQPIPYIATEVMQCVPGIPPYSSSNPQDGSLVPAVASYEVRENVVGIGSVTFVITQSATWSDIYQGSSSSVYKCLDAYVKVQWRQEGSVAYGNWPSTWPYIGTLPSTNWPYVSRSSLGSCEPEAQLVITPTSAQYDDWEGTAYYDASPGNTSPTQVFTLTVEPPQMTGDAYDYVVIGQISISGSTDFRIAGNDCSGLTLYSPATGGPSPTSCTFSVLFSPPASAVPRQSVSASVLISDNAEGSPQRAMLSGYVSPDLFVVK